MGKPMNLWWEDIDREEAISSAVSAASNGGCLVLCGADNDGPSQALRQIRAALDGLDIEHAIAEVTLDAPTKKTHLLAVWKALKPIEDVSAIPQWGMFSNADPGTIADRLVSDLRNHDGARVVLVPDIDRYRTLEVYEVARLAGIARHAGIGVIVTARQSEPWTYVPEWTRIELRHFKRSDIEDCVSRRPQDPWMSDRELESLVDKVMLAADGRGLIRPLDAYEILGVLAGR